MVCCAGDLLINPTSLIALTLPARLLSSHYPPFVFVRGQMLSPVKVTDSYFYQTNTALYPVKSENSPTTADDR